MSFDSMTKVNQKIDMMKNKITSSRKNYTNNNGVCVCYIYLLYIEKYICIKDVYNTTSSIQLTN